MIVLPWFIRFGLDCTVALTPLIYLHHHPSTFFFEYFQNRRRLVRRRSFEEVQINTDSTIQVEQAQEIFKELGIEQ